MRWTYTASGPITNISARIGAIGEEFAVEEVGPQNLKNVEHPVMVYRPITLQTGAGPSAAG